MDVKTNLALAAIVAMTSCTGGSNSPKDSQSPGIPGVPLVTAHTGGGEPELLSADHVVANAESVPLFQSDMERILRNPDWIFIGNCASAVGSAVDYDGILAPSISIQDGGRLPIILQFEDAPGLGVGNAQVEPIGFADGRLVYKLQFGFGGGPLLFEDVVRRECMYINQSAQAAKLLIERGAPQDSILHATTQARSWAQRTDSCDRTFQAGYLPWWYQCRSACSRDSEWYFRTYKSGSYGLAFCELWRNLFDSGADAPDFDSDAWVTWEQTLGDLYLRYHKSGQD